MAWFVPHMFRTRRRHPTAVRGLGASALPADFDRLLDTLRVLRIAVPCAGCGDAHEMTAAELLARQLIQGAAWTSEECDEGVTLRAILSVEEIIACRGDVVRIRARLEQRGVRCTDVDSNLAVAGRREAHHLLPAH